MHLCLEENKRQQKCHVDSVCGVTEGRVTTRCVGARKIYNDERFLLQSREQSRERERE